jgi:hypothetical protein
MCSFKIFTLKILIHNVVVEGGEAFASLLGHESRAFMNGSGAIHENMRELAVCLPSIM